MLVLALVFVCQFCARICVLVLVRVLALMFSLLHKAKVAGSPRVPGGLRLLVSLALFFRAHAAEGTLDLTACP